MKKKIDWRDIIIWILGKQTIPIFIAGMSVTTLVKVNILETGFKFLAKDFKEHRKHK